MEDLIRKILKEDRIRHFVAKDEWTEEDGFTNVFFTTDDNLAIARLVLWHDNDGSDATIDSVNVSMDSRGLGIGTELMNHIIDYAKNKGVKNILLYTVKGSRQWKWYEKLGFVEYTRDTELVSGKYNWMVYTK